MEENILLDEVASHITELHDIARKSENNQLTKSMAYKVRTFADELNVKVVTLKNENFK